MRIAFKYAFAKKDSVNNDRLQLMVTNNCGSTWIQRLNLTGAALETAPPQPGTWFIPGNTSEWKQASASIPTAYLTNDFRFKLVHTAYGGNNLYIDDINIDVTAGVDELQQNISGIQVYPNPATEQVNLLFDLAGAETLSVSITDMLGKTVYQSNRQQYAEGKNQVSINTANLAPGMYRVSLHNSWSHMGQLLVVSGK